MSATAKRVRSVVITVIAIAATNYAISFASGISQPPDAPRPRSGQTLLGSGISQPPDAPRPKSGISQPPDAPRPKSGISQPPDAPRP